MISQCLWRVSSLCYDPVKVLKLKQGTRITHTQKKEQMEHVTAVFSVCFIALLAPHER